MESFYAQFRSPKMGQHNRMYGFVRSRQLEGTFPGDPKTGVWPITAHRVSKGWGSPPEEAWPYDSSSWPPKEPDIDIDSIARGNKLLAYQRIRTCYECKLAIAKMAGVLFSAEITDSWIDNNTGEIPMPKPDDKIIGSHSVCLLGYDDSKASFRFVNSWGVTWGDNGCGYFSYEFFEKFNIETWISLPYDVDFFEPEIFQTQSKVIFYRLIPTAVHSNIHLLEITDNVTNDYKGWAFGVEYEGFLNVEEVFILPTFRCKGLAKALLGHLNRLAKRVAKPLRFWVPFADSEAQNMEVILHLAKIFGYEIIPAPVRWADYIMARGLSTKGNTKRFSRPSKPGFVLPCWDVVNEE